MKQKPFSQRVGDFMEGRGFYIVLFLCVAAIGISGYFLFSGMLAATPLNEPDPSQQVRGQAEVQVDPPSISTTAPQFAEETVPTQGSAAEAEASASPSQATVFTWPVRGTVSRDYSLEVFAYDATMGDWRTHSGIDIDAALGTEVMAVTAGTVSDIRQDPLMGTTVVIGHGDDLESVYSNLAAQPAISVGDRVTPGTVIGAIGNTAISESAANSHLHFEMLRAGVSIDPVQFLPDGN